jgi:hypothetical protein
MRNHHKVLPFVTGRENLTNLYLVIRLLPFCMGGPGNPGPPFFYFDALAVGLLALFFPAV